MITAINIEANKYQTLYLEKEKQFKLSEKRVISNLKLCYV